MDMGRKLTVLWNERELSNSAMLFTCFCCRAVLPNVPYRLNAQFGHLVTVQIRKLRTEREITEWFFKAFNCLRDFYLQVSDLSKRQIENKHLGKLQENNP